MSYSIHLRLKELLDERRINQKDLARMTGIRESTISDLCRGTRTVMNYAHIAKIAEVLNVTDIRDLIDLKTK